MFLPKGLTGMKRMLFALTVVLFVSTAAGPPKTVETQKDRLQTLRDQARRMRTELPDLYSFLVERDAVLEQAIFEMAALIPDPEKFPPIKFLDAVDELLAPKTDEECKQLLEPDTTTIEIKSAALRERLRAMRMQFYAICRNGVHVRKTGLQELA